VNGADVPPQDGRDIEQIRHVVAALAELLEEHASRPEVRRLEENLLELGQWLRSPEAVAEAVHRLHRMIPGMGGLTDIYLHAAPGTGRDDNAELRRLTDELGELTR
jgi:hypothetical protein